MSPVRFSIIIPVYNVADFLDRTMDSVLRQNFGDFETILIENASTDMSADCMKKYQNDAKLKTIFLKNNRGTGGARNVGLECAEGEYILFLDGDDRLFDGQTLSRIDQVIGGKPIDIGYFGYQEEGGDNNRYLSTAENSTKSSRIRCDIANPVWSKCWRREFLRSHHFHFAESQYYEDMAFSFRGNLLSKSYVVGEFPIISYTRQRTGSVMSLATVKKCSDLYRYMADIMDLYSEVPMEYREDFFSFMEGEDKKMSARIRRILTAMEEGRQAPIQPKRG